MLFNTKLFDAKGRRVAVAATEKDGKLSYFIEKCSPKDAFCKKLASSLASYYFENGMDAFKRTFPHYHPQTGEMPIQRNPSKDFYSYCNATFFPLWMLRREIEDTPDGD
jgi:hypothetical protein